MRRSFLCSVFLLASVAFLSSTALGAETGPSGVLMLGPLPLPVESADRGPMAPELEPVMEIDPLTARPEAGQIVVVRAPALAVRWRKVTLKDGGFHAEASGVYWATTRFDLDRWAKVKLEASGKDVRGLLWVDGERRGMGEATLLLWRGRHTLVVRLEVKGERGASVRIASDAGPGAALSWDPPGPAPLTDLEQTRRLVSLGPLAVSPGGSLIARRISWMEPGASKRSHRMDVLDSGGKIVAASVGGPGASPVGFFPGEGSPRLLFRRKGRLGTDLLVFDMGDGTVRTVVRGEPGLAFVRISPSGRWLLLASARGVKKEKKEEGSPRRRKALREKLTDYQVRRQLFLLDVDSGTRRLLIPAGDHCLDDARFWGESGVRYLVTIPMDERPWFVTEVRRLEMISGRDTLLASFRGGWEGRPTTLALAEGGEAFIGPPEEIGPGRQEHNVYNRRVWLVNREAGTFRRIMGSKAPAATLGRAELLQPCGEGPCFLVGVTEGSKVHLAFLRGGGGAWRLDPIPTRAEVIGPVAVSPDGGTAAYVAQSRIEPPDLRVLDLKTGRETVVERPNAAVAAGWKLSRPEDSSFEGPGGETIDAWWYPPAVKIDPGRTPLIVYYYGGATPTTRRFSGTHQVLAGNGYAVLVLNPRGALGYGDRFADAHVDDWGPRASADILAGVEAFLAAHPEVDGKRVGIYGGSYGGFMTEYLVAHSDRFAAAVAMYGISDIASYWGAGTWGYTYGDTALAGSFPWNAASLFSGRSPLYAADRITTPLLLLHGLADVNVPEEESEQLYTALRTLGRRVELVTFPGEDHGIAGSWKNWIAHRRMMVEFFDRILRDQPGAWNERWGLGGHPAE